VDHVPAQPCPEVWLDVLVGLAGAGGAIRSGLLLDLGPTELADLGARLRAHLDHMLAILTEIEATYASDDDVTVDEWESLFADHAISGRRPARAADDMVGDACFAARSDLRRVLAQAGAARDPADWISRAARKLARAAIAVCEAVCATEGLPSRVGELRLAQVAAAVGVRAMYAKLRDAVAGPDPDDLIAMVRTIRLAGTSLAKMIGSPWFCDARVEDRRTIIGLQRRLVAWIRSPVLAAGRELLSDLRTTADLLLRINLRQELQLHDARRLAAARAELAAGGAPATVLPWLRDLRGRSAELDRAVAAGLADRDPAALIDLLDGIACALPEPP